MSGLSSIEPKVPVNSSAPPQAATKPNLRRIKPSAKLSSASPLRSLAQMPLLHLTEVLYFPQTPSPHRFPRQNLRPRLGNLPLRLPTFIHHFLRLFRRSLLPRSTQQTRRPSEPPRYAERKPASAETNQRLARGIVADRGAGFCRPGGGGGGYTSGEWVSPYSPGTEIPPRCRADVVEEHGAAHH